MRTLNDPRGAAGITRVQIRRAKGQDEFGEALAFTEFVAENFSIKSKRSPQKTEPGLSLSCVGI